MIYKHPHSPEELRQLKELIFTEDNFYFDKAGKLRMQPDIAAMFTEEIWQLKELEGETLSFELDLDRVKRSC